MLQISQRDKKSDTFKNILSQSHKESLPRFNLEPLPRKSLTKLLLLQWHQRALDIAEQTGCVRGQGRAYGNLGVAYEALGKYERAVVFQEQHLSVAAQTNDLLAKTLAYGSLGRTHHALQNYAQAVMYLQEGEGPSRGPKAFYTFVTLSSSHPVN